MLRFAALGCRMYRVYGSGVLCEGSGLMLRIQRDGFRVCGYDPDLEGKVSC